MHGLEAFEGSRDVELLDVVERNRFKDQENNKLQDSPSVGVWEIELSAFESESIGALCISVGVRCERP